MTRRFPLGKTFALATAIAFAGLIGGCVPRIVGEITDMSPVVDVVAPRFVVDAAGTRIDRFDPPGAGAGLALTIAVDVLNPNAFDLLLERVEYGLRVGGERIAANLLEPGLLVPALGSARLVWSVEASLADVPGLWRDVVGTFAGAPLPFEVEGQLRFLSEVFVFTTGVRPLFTGELRARQAIDPPTVSIVAGREQAIVARADAPALRFTLSFRNPGDVGYFVSARSLQLALLVPRSASDARTEGAVVGGPLPPTPTELAEALPVGTVDLPPLPVPAGATAEADLLVVLDPARLPPAAAARVEALLKGQPTTYVIGGALVYDVLGVDSFAVPSSEPLWGVFDVRPLGR